MASNSLGPFPKTKRWVQIVAETLPPSRRFQAAPLADHLLGELQTNYESLKADPEAILAISYVVGLPVASRRLELPQLGDLAESPSLTAQAVRAFTRRYQVHARLANPLIETDGVSMWRGADGAGFCDLAQQFYTELNRVFFEDALASQGLTAPERTIGQFAEEMSLITRAFSARWFNSCARHQEPDAGSVAWYLGHCLGKLDLELARELSTWQEPARASRRQADTGQMVFSF